MLPFLYVFLKQSRQQLNYKGFLQNATDMELPRLKHSRSLLTIFLHAKTFLACYFVVLDNVFR